MQIMDFLQAVKYKPCEAVPDSREVMPETNTPAYRSASSAERVKKEESRKTRKTNKGSNDTSEYRRQYAKYGD
jgi:hypothetical protein